jgi:hypothetical protein
MRRSQAVQEEGANRAKIPAPNIQEGDRVWLDARNIRTPRPTQRWDWKRLALSKVTRRISPYAYELDLPASIRIHRVQPFSLFDPVIDDPLVRQLREPSPPVDMDGEVEFQCLVLRIVGCTEVSYNTLYDGPGMIL